MATTDTYNESLDQILRQFDRETGRIRPVILICGYVGCGKTTLIQSVFGKALVPDYRIGTPVSKTKYFDEYSNSSIRIWDSRGFEAGEREKDFLKDTRNFIQEKRKTKTFDDDIHLVWYCIQGNSKITKCDEHLIKDIFGCDNTVVVITKKDTAEPHELYDKFEYLKATGISSDNIIAVSKKDDESIKQLVKRTHMLLPEAQQDAFLAAQVMDLDWKEIKAHAVIHTATVAAASVAAFPIPGPDAPILMTIQATMIGSLAYLYGFDKKLIRGMVLPEIAKMTGKYLALSLTKLIPGYGSVINSAVAATITEILGWQVQKYLSKSYKARLLGIEAEAFKFDWDEFERVFKTIYDGFERKKG